MEKIQVLMSTYNGEKYIEEQINSILNQKGVNVDLLIRDDGSNDSTIEKLNKYENKINFYIGENIKPAKSFMELIKNAGDYNFFAFADQDDIWKEQKLNRAINKIKEIDNGQPIIYFSDKELIDEKLNTIYHKKINYNLSFKSAMIRNIATGCTIVINKKLMEIIKQYEPTYLEMHDAWIYRVCLAIGGSVIYDDCELIKYRQHNNNVIGAKESLKKQIIRRINSFKNCKHVREKTAQEMLKAYANIITKENLKVIKAFANYRKSIRCKLLLLFDYNLKTEKIKDDIIFKVALLINRV